MAIRVSHYAIIGMALLLGGCAYADNLFGVNASGKQASQTNAASTSPPRAPATVPSTSGAMASAPTVGEQTQRLRSDLGQLKSRVPQRQQDFMAARTSAKHDFDAYVRIVTRVAGRVKSGATAGNPHLLAQWTQAQSSLNHLIGDIDQLSRLSNQVAADISYATHLTKTTNDALTLQGAVDEDHRQLTKIKEQLDGTASELNALLKSVTDEITHQSENVASGSETLTALAQAIRTGTYSESARVTSAIPTHHAARGREASVKKLRPFVVIRFKVAEPNYVDALYTAVSRALKRDPAVKFDLVAVSPAAGTADQIASNSAAAKKNAEGVMRSLVKMGLPVGRLTLSATTSSDVQTDEVRIYAR